MNDAATLFDACDALLFDLDGTVYRGGDPVPGAADAVTRARGRGTPVRFVTNNASKAPDAVVAHLADVGVPAGDDEVSTSAQAGARLLAERLPSGSTVLVVGTEALADQVAAAGLKPVRTADDDVAGVVQGHSPETAWPVLAEACLAIRAGAVWVACNEDTTLPAERGLLPGNGAMVAALRAATGEAPLVAGKPETPLLRLAADSAESTHPLVVGDRLDTDIAGAVAAGMDSLAVLTGVVTPAGLVTAEPTERPRYIAADLAALDEPAALVAVGPQEAWHVDTGGDALTVTTAGTGEHAGPVALLRGLCDAAWRTGTTAVRAGDTAAETALAELGLG
ncbi:MULTISPECIES: HAD-IIA family hydrolase [Prauserella salsuginis group]|uniref:HAD-IIA family hydrolase n=1 Tax=Prauserella salsuginis TaxID=387889 RepID=A0ABW6GA24_9PSEU|nr:MULTISPECIES: HAD-IIA family hydrolase [Prauserella salsuginis group]MCR3723025.1 Haloacid Dehalogenase Superfamily Class (subfamily) IIA [Prauserella flava]MCR3732600.1 Haloacid Dehalogenase Superfamily Class (subfamily) IIA [Prauserella salsuginis]